MFFNNYSKPGKGVNKRDPNQPRLQVFFDILPRKLWDILKLHLVYSATILPFFLITMIVVGVLSSNIMQPAFLAEGATSNLVLYDILFRFFFAFLFTVFLGHGPLTAGYTYVMREYGRELPCWKFSDFFGYAKKNFKQGILLWIVDLIAVYFFTIAFVYYSHTHMFFLQAVVLMGAVIYGMIHIYVYQMMVGFQLSFKHLIKNSFLLSLINLPLSLSILGVYFLIYTVIPIIVLLNTTSLIILLIIFLIVFLILPGITCFTANFLIYPILNKYINSEQNVEE